jgi:fatty acid desaturase
VNWPLLRSSEYRPERHSIDDSHCEITVVHFAFGIACPVDQVRDSLFHATDQFTDSLRIARRTGRLQGRLWRQTALQLLSLALLVAVNPLMALTFFIVPNVILRWTVFYFSFAQHAEAPLEDVYSGSVTRFGWTNAVFLNVGHHTAHHEKPTLHWSLLPERTARILDRIPASCLRGVP